MGPLSFSRVWKNPASQKGLGEGGLGPKGSGKANEAWGSPPGVGV